MNLYIDIHEQKEYLERLLGICPHCLIDALKAEIEFVLDFYEEDNPSIYIKELIEWDVGHNNSA